MTRTLLTTFALLALSMTIVGCGGGGAADTPKGTMENFVAAIEDGDTDAFVDCFDATDEQKEMLEAMGDMLFAMKDFQEKLVDEYGEEAVNSAGNSSMDMPDKSDLDKLDVKIDGDKATVTAPDGGDPMQMIQKDGLWYINVASMGEIPTDDAEKLKAMSKAVVEAADEVSKNIGKEGYTPEKLQQEFGMKMMGAMLGGALQNMGE